MELFEIFGCGIFADALAKFSQRWGIIDPADKARFLGQLSVESLKFTRTTENLNYRPQRLLDVFKGRNGLQTLDQATAIVTAGADSVAEAIYGLPWGATHLGNTEPGDGAKFPGRGLIMLTGKTNYHDASFGCYGDDRLLRMPGLLGGTDVAAEIACWFWYNRKLSIITDVTAITQRVNGGQMGLAERIAETQRALSLVEQGAT